MQHIQRVFLQYFFDKRTIRNNRCYVSLEYCRRILSLRCLLLFFFFVEWMISGNLAFIPIVFGIGPVYTLEEFSPDNTKTFPTVHCVSLQIFFLSTKAIFAWRHFRTAVFIDSSMGLNLNLLSQSPCRHMRTIQLFPHLPQYYSRISVPPQPLFLMASMPLLVQSKRFHPGIEVSEVVLSHWRSFFNIKIWFCTNIQLFYHFVILHIIDFQSHNLIKFSLIDWFACLPAHKLFMSHLMSKFKANFEAIRIYTLFCFHKRIHGK